MAKKRKFNPKKRSVDLHTNHVNPVDRDVVHGLEVGNRTGPTSDHLLITASTGSSRQDELLDTANAECIVNIEDRTASLVDKDEPTIGRVDYTPAVHVDSISEDSPIDARLRTQTTIEIGECIRQPLDEVVTELARLRSIVAAQREKLVTYESLNTENMTLVAEVQRLNQLLVAEKALRDKLFQREEELNDRDRNLLMREERIETMSASWDASMVETLQLQCAQLELQLQSNREANKILRDEIQSLRRQLEQVNEEDYQRIQEDNLRLRQEISRLVSEQMALRSYEEEVNAKKEILARAGDWERQNRALLAERAGLQIRNDELEAKLAHMQAQDALVATYRSMVEHGRLAIAEMKQQVDALNESEKRRQERGSRVYGTFASILKAYPQSVPVQRWPGDGKMVSTIQDLARQTGFAFASTQIRSFLAAMRSSRLIIIKGFSGLGKTSLPILVARALRAPCEVIPVQPSWRSKSDLMGFYNHFEQRYLPTQFAKALFKAQMPPFHDRHFFIVLDEMNLARIEYYFNDFNVKLEDPNDPKIELFEHSISDIELPPGGLGEYIYHGNQIRIPPNVTFIGTINDDETTFSISDKIYDRAQVLHFVTDQARASQRGQLPTEDDLRLAHLQYPSFLSYKEETDSVKRWDEDGQRIFDEFMDTLNNEVQKRFAAYIGPRVRGQISDFMRAYQLGNGDSFEGLDLQLVSKVLPKIRYSHRASFQESIKEFSLFLKDNWPKRGDAPELTLHALKLLQANS